MTEIKGTVEKITFSNRANGFTVLEISTEDELLTVVGSMPEVKVGEQLQVFGKYDFHSTFGPQFKAQQVIKIMPSTATAILRYLSGGGIKGIGPAKARKIVEMFGSQALSIIETDPIRLTSIKGISKAQALNYQSEYLNQIGVRELMLYLSEYNITADEALKTYRELGPGSIEKIKANPFCLCSDNLPFDFERVDSIAHDMGFEESFSYRRFSGIEYVLRHNLSNGHTCIPKDKLIAVSSELLGIDSASICESVDGMINAGKLVPYEVDSREMIFLPHLYKAESSAAIRITTLLKSPRLNISEIDKKVKKVEKAAKIKFEQKQLDAIHAVADSGILVLTGGPGTGKTTTLNAIIQVFESIGLKLALAAPTGRSAKRMTEVTGKEAKTVHRLLEAGFDNSGRVSFCKNRHNPLDCDLLIIDEFSMVDTLLFDNLLEALPLGCRLILVGDADQLPSVSAGLVLRDLVDSGCVPVVELKTVFRQAMQSAIVTNAHLINCGQEPDLKIRDSDFYFIACDEPEKVADKVTQLTTQRLPAAYGYTVQNDIQVLCPSRKRKTGTGNINNILQQALNPKSPNKKELVFKSFVLREGDKVIQVKNNYDILWQREDLTEGMGVFNGDVGVLERIDLSMGIFTVRYDDKVAVYPVEFAEQIELAYAVTIHKSQGSEYECVVLTVSDMPAQLRYRNLLYTAVTRAKSMLVVVGSRKVINEMVNNDRRVKRYTALKNMLKELCN